MTARQHQPELSFDAFWNAYPRHQAKKRAKDIWYRLDPDALLVETILQALAWQRLQPQWLKHGGAYVPYPTSWLHGERWNDERPTELLQPNAVMTRFVNLGAHRKL